MPKKRRKMDYEEKNSNNENFLQQGIFKVNLLIKFKFSKRI